MMLMLMHPASAKGLTPISELLKLGTTSPYIALGGGFVGESSLLQGVDDNVVCDFNRSPIWSQSQKSGKYGISCFDEQASCSCVQDDHS